MVIKGFTEKKGANHSSRERVFQAEETTMTVFLSIRCQVKFRNKAKKSRRKVQRET